MNTQEESNEQYYPGAVLLSDQIQKLVNSEKLIVHDPYYEDVGDTFDKKQLKRAKYDVRLGKAYYKDEKYGILDNEHPLLKIEPYEMVFVESYEVFNMPENVVAVYDLRINCCLGGLGLQTGLQLDPTYYGRFFCPLFNFSDTIVTLKYKDQLASVQFIYTTPPPSHIEEIEPESFDKKKYGSFSLQQILPDVPRRSGLERIRKELESFEKEKNLLQTKIDSMVGSVFHAMAFMIGALAVMAATITIAITEKPSGAEFSFAIGIFIFIALAALIIILQTRRKYKEATKKEKNG